MRIASLQDELIPAAGFDFITYLQGRLRSAVQYAWCYQGLIRLELHPPTYFVVSEVEVYNKTRIL